MKKHLSRRDFLKTMGLATGGTLLAACATATAEVIEKTVEVEVEKEVTPVPGETVKLSFWHGDWSVWNPHFDGLAARALYAGVTPKIELDAPPMPWNEYWDKVTISGEAGVGPDILYLNYNSYKRLYDAKAVRAVPESVYPYSDLEKDFKKIAMDVLNIYDGKYYYVPWELHPPGSISYNKSLLEREGFDEPPTNWKEFLDIAQTCVKREDDQLTQSGLGMDGPFMFLYTILLPSIGGEGPTPFDETPDKMKSDYAAEAFELLADYNRKHDILHPDFLIEVGGWWGGAYLVGKVAFEWWYSGANITLEEQTLDKGGGFDTKIALPKLGPDGFKGGTRPNWGPGITSACPEEKLDAAWNFWKFTLSHDELHEYVKLTMLPSSRESVLALGRDAWPEGPRGDEAAIEAENINCCSFIFGQAENNDIWRTAFQDTWDDIMIDGMTAKAAIENNWATYEEGWTGEAA